MGNTFKTAFLLTLLTLLLMFIGRFFGGQNGMLLALAFAAVMNFVSYFYSDKIALAMYRAQPADSVNSLLADRLTGRKMESDARNGAIEKIGGLLTCHASADGTGTNSGSRCNLKRVFGSLPNQPANRGSFVFVA